jgi:endonuclease/exonuclease/phosphatase family metal-dependent hydrolase
MFRRYSRVLAGVLGVYGLLGILGLLCALPAYAEKEITVATFNCEFMTRPKVHLKFGEPFELKGAKLAEWDKPGVRDAKFAEAAQAVAKVIVQINADVIGLEEVGDEKDVQELRAAVKQLGLDYPYCFVGGPVEESTFQNNAVFSKFELKDGLASIPGKESFYAEPDDDDTEEWTGVRKGLRVTFAAHGQTFYLYVVHLTSERGGYDADARRVAEASIVRRHYLPLLAEGKNVIVMGDMNDRRGDPAINRIRGLDDIQPDLIQTGLYNYFPREKQDTRWTYEFRGTREQIDHVLLSDSIEDCCTQIRSETLHHGDKLASDHSPFIVKLTVR